MTVQVKASADNTYGALQVNGVDKLYFGKTGDNLEAVTNSTLSGYSQRTLTAAVATTSGTAIDFTGIPSWAKKVTVQLYGVSLSGASVGLIQLGTSLGVENSGYTAQTMSIFSNASFAAANYTTGVAFGCGLASAAAYGSIVFTLLGSNIWVVQGSTANTNTSANPYTHAGAKSLSGTLDRIRLTTVNGTDTFDAGSVSLLIEG